jgi:predicted nucleic acid-binding protein
MSSGTKHTSLNGRIRYAESSAVAAALLEHNTDAASALQKNGQLLASALMPAEVRRAIVRARHTARLDDDQARQAATALAGILERCELLEISSQILERVGRPYALEPLRALDAIHIATIEAISDHPNQTTVITRDRRIRENALALGCRVE